MLLKKKRKSRPRSEGTRKHTAQKGLNVPRRGRTGEGPR